MRKLAKTALLTVLISAGNVAVAEDGRISFDGTISDATCIITGGDGQGETASPNFTVHLPPVSTTALAAKGERAGDTNFYINLSGANCEDGKIASVYFEVGQSVNIDPETGNLKNTIAETNGGAGNVQVGLLNASKAVLNLNTPTTDTTTKTIKDNTARFDYWAQYVATDGAATAGRVNTDVAYSIKYQ